MSDLNNLISIIIPAFRAEHSIFILCKEILKVFSDHKTEIVITNDCSPDKTHDECLKLIKEYPQKITYIKLSKNVGEHNAVMAGLKHSRGKWVIIMDDDFQNPPAEALKLLTYSINNKFDVVYGDYRKKKHSFLRNFMSKINDISANYILKKPKGLYLSSFKCLKKTIVKKIINYEGPNPYVDGLILSVTSNIGSIKTLHAEREAGKSGYSFLKLIKLYGNLMTNFSTVPIHIFSMMGFIIAFLIGIYTIFVILEKISNPNLPVGYTSLFIAIIFFSGVQLIFLGLLGEYIGKILKIVNKDPQYSIEYIKLNDSDK